MRKRVIALLVTCVLVGLGLGLRAFGDLQPISNEITRVLVMTAAAAAGQPISNEITRVCAGDTNSPACLAGGFSAGSLTFDSHTPIPMASATPGTGQCLTFDGTQIIGAACGSGTTITSGAGDFGASTSQTGGVLTGAVAKVNGNTPGVAAVTHNFVTAIDTSARGTLAQPACADLSNSGPGCSQSTSVSSVAGTANQVSVATGTTTAVVSLVGPYTPATYTTHGVLIGEGTSSIVALTALGADTLLQGVASADPTSVSVPNCTDSAGNHLNYTTSTHLFSCGTTASVAGTVTNVTGTANQINVATGSTTPALSLIGPYTPATYTAHGNLVGEGTSSIAATAVCGTGSILYGQSAADPICSTSIWPNSATTGDILMATSANTFGSLADVAVGQVLTSGGTSTAAAYSASPNVTSISTGTNPNITAGTGGVLAQTEGTAPTAKAATDILWADGTSHAFKLNNNNGTTEIVVGSSTGVVESQLAVSGLLGAQASTAAATLLQVCDTALSAGHFTNLTCTNDFLTACTTAPAFNVRDNTGSTTGTAKTCGTAAGQVTQSQILTFAAGDQICIVRTQNGATCTVPFFSVVAHLSYP